MPTPETLKRYKAVLGAFMSLRDGTAYPQNTTFSCDQLLAITDVDVESYLRHKAFGTVEVDEHSRPTSSRINSLKFDKKAISHFMPRRTVPWDDINHRGNPTMSSAVKKLLDEVGVFEVRGEGVPPNARRPLEWEEFVDTLIAAHQTLSAETKHLMLAVLTLQWQFIGRIDDMMKLATSTIVKHMQYPFALSLKMCWSKTSVQSVNAQPRSFSLR